jgi:putative transposase
MVSPAKRREVVAQILRGHPEVSERRACQIIGVNRSSIRYRCSQKRTSEEVLVTRAIKSSHVASSGVNPVPLS